jgi:hypothetical protein
MLHWHVLHSGDKSVTYINFVGVEILTASVFWHVALCSPLTVNRRFRGACCMYLEVRRVSITAWNRQQAKAPWRWNCFFPLKYTLSFNEEQVIIWQDVEAVQDSWECSWDSCAFLRMRARASWGHDPHQYNASRDQLLLLLLSCVTPRDGEE